MKTYEMQCPDPDCLTTLTLEMDPQDGETESIECPECLGEYGYIFNAEADTVTLVALEDDEEDEEEEGDEEDGFEDEDDDEDDDEDYG